LKIEKYAFSIIVRDITKPVETLGIVKARPLVEGTLENPPASVKQDEVPKVQGAACAESLRQKERVAQYPI